MQPPPADAPTPSPSGGNKPTLFILLAVINMVVVVAVGVMLYLGQKKKEAEPNVEDVIKGEKEAVDLEGRLQRIFARQEPAPAGVRTWLELGNRFVDCRQRSSSSHRTTASRHGRQCTQAPFTFCGKAENSLDVLTTQLREIGQYCLLIHSARQVLEYIGHSDARSLDTRLATPDAGGN